LTGQDRLGEFASVKEEYREWFEDLERQGPEPIDAWKAPAAPRLKLSDISFPESTQQGQFEKNE
jgi:hypothetical protein